MSCIAQTARKVGSAVDPQCLAKHATKFSDPVQHGCYDQATNACANATTAATAKTAADLFIAGAACNLLPGATPCTPVCGNGFVEPGEPCDGVDVGTCGAEFTCTSCNCGCPTTLDLAEDAAGPETIIDRGWTGLAHRLKPARNSDVTLGVACTATARPCGVCNLSGPMPNAGAGALQNRRCTEDTRVACTSDDDCGGPGGTCEFFLGSVEPISGGGVGVCVTNQFLGGVTGTVDVESGALATSSVIVQRIYAGLIDTPCPQCVGDASANDGVAGGTCSGGDHDGESCDANGSVPDRPDFGATSFDCPPSAASFLSGQSLAGDYSSGTVTKVVSASSPRCSGFVYSGIPQGSRCLCDTCNNANAEPCDDNADCPDPAGPVGPVCGGRRCIGGSNNGTPCSAGSECPGGGLCNRPGEPTIPSTCLIDDSSYPPDAWVGCVDTAPIDGEGECDFGPIERWCSTASGHAQRGCVSDEECGDFPGGCQIRHRACFLTGPFSLWPGGQGTGTLEAVGMVDTPVADAFAPTLASVACSGASSSGALNASTGLPGPVRETRHTLATFHP